MNLTTPIKLTISNYRPFSEENPLEIEVKNGVTAIVGPNNCGKSFVLKFFFENRELLNLLRDESNIWRIIEGSNLRCSFSGVKHNTEPHYKFNDKPITLKFNANNIEFVVKRSTGSDTWEPVYFSVDKTKIDNKSKNKDLLIVARPTKNTVVIIDKEKGGKRKEVNLSDIGAQFEILAGTIYFPSFRNAINVGTQPSFYDIAIGHSFIEALEEFKTNDDPNVRIKTEGMMEDLREIFGYDKFDIIASPKRGELIVNINGDSQLLGELGSGLSQFILVFINAAIKKPSFILIDEPELNLHPKLQIEFINRLLKYCGNGIIFATHSLGLAHSTAERIYIVQRTEDERRSLMRPFESTPSIIELLGELNFSGFPDLGYKKVLLVEGPTDLKVFSIFLRKMGKAQEYLLWPLGGSSMINKEAVKDLSQLDRLGSKVKKYCWIDSDRTKKSEKLKKNINDFYEECKKLNINISISEKRSIENYFPQPAIEQINNLIPRFGPFERLPKEWNKGDNWKIAYKTDIEDLRGTDLHTFLKTL